MMNAAIDDTAVTPVYLSLFSGKGFDVKIGRFLLSFHMGHVIINNGFATIISF